MSVKRATAERWSEAQAWEASVWRKAEGKSGPVAFSLSWASRLARFASRRTLQGDDWNHWWARQFHEYDFLPGSVDNYIELGCGPYTNSRLILHRLKAKHVFCSDPLALHYVRLGTCWLAQQARKGRVLVDDHPIEHCPFADSFFDVVVIINVLDHVQDFDLCMRQANRIVKAGGVLIIGQDLTNQEDLTRAPHDVGHPIRLALEDIEPHLAGMDPLVSNVLQREDGRNPAAHYGTLLFAGRKLPEPC